MSNILVTTNQSVIEVTDTSGITVTTPEGQTINVTVPNSSVNVTNTTDNITVLTSGTLIIEDVAGTIISVNGQTGPIVVLDTDDISEGATNKYFSQALARQSLSAGTGISYDNSTGVITNTSINTDTTYTQNASTATGGANLNLVGSDSTVDTVKFASGTGITVARTDADTITITNTVPDTNTTYTIASASTTGGANLTLTGSDSSTDSVAYLGSGATTVTSTDANTVTITSTDTNTTYTQDATSTTGGANLNLVGSDATTDSIAVLGSGATTVTRTDANTVTVSSTDTNTTYTQNATSTTGGANLNLVGSDATTDSVAYLGSGATTVTRTDADTITISSTDTNTTYTQNISSTTGGANLNLVGSDSTTDTVKFASGTGVTVAYTDADTATISIGQSVGTGDNPIFAGGTFGNVTVGIDTDQTISTTTGNLILQTAAGVNAGTMTFTAGANGAITLDPNGTGNVVMTFANGGNLTNDRNYVMGAIRQAVAQTAGDMWGFNTGITNPYRGISLDNYATSTTTTGKRTGMVLRNYANAPRNSIIGESARGTNPSTPTQLTNGNNIIEIIGNGWAGVSDGTGFTSTGSTITGTTLTIGTLVSGTPAVGQLISSYTFGAGVTTGTRITANISGSGSGSTWTVSNSQTVGSADINGGGDGWLSSIGGLSSFMRFQAAENWTNQTAGTSMIVGLSPLAATNGIAGQTVNALTMNLSNTTFQSGQYNFQPSPLNPLFDGNMNFNITNNRATSGSQLAVVNFTTQRSATGSAPFSPTQNGDRLGQFKFNGNSYTGNPGVPGGPTAAISSFATENWTGFTANASSISGTTLTIGTITNGAPVVGQSVYGTGVTAGTKILANISGSGSGSTWTVSPSQTVGPVTMYGGANGGSFSFNSVKTGTLDAYDVISGSVTSLAFNSDTINFNNFNSTVNRISVNDSSATINLPVNLYEIGGVTPLVGNKISYNRVYGQWQNLNTVTPAASNTAYAFALPTVDYTNIASVVSTSRITPGAAGMYKLQFSAQVQNTDTADEHFAYFWWRKNGTDIPGSMGRVGIFKAKGAVNGLTIAGWDNMISSANSTDYWELMYAVDNATHIDFPAFTTTAFGPETSSLFVTLVPVGA